MAKSSLVFPLKVWNTDYCDPEYAVKLFLTWLVAFVVQRVCQRPLFTKVFCLKDFCRVGGVTHRAKTLISNEFFMRWLDLNERVLAAMQLAVYHFSYNLPKFVWSFMYFVLSCDALNSSKSDFDTDSILTFARSDKVELQKQLTADWFRRISRLIW